MSLKLPLIVVATTLVFSSSSVFASKDYCTPKLNLYLKGIHDTVNSQYVSERQKEVAKKILDKVKANRDKMGDCALLDKLLP
ncbi:hypothetical protein MSP8887_02870 [Marinomonas spartinae]|uniref:Uncharacterized protein n=1 Tax=Marinomonas spartinae TaxID=1792290 RepID=A0A1A8TDC5_9GAMM|nr:hypothetical protein [Marinomonas spartinae]SBS29737.1 hypothetical protein MSP8886_01589 [Marinomonas spartinae]SBS37287.1 hypothetical protein MSP8887_02870 [Marinomonas spartinae]